MSQPLNFGPDQVDPYNIDIKNKEQLKQIFYDHEVKNSNLLMGIEYEIFAHDQLQKRPLAYEGLRSISSLYFYMQKQSVSKSDPWFFLMEENNIVALNNKKATIALEPGGQIEIAAKPHNSLEKMLEAFREVLYELHDCAQDLNINLFALGIHPLAKRTEMAHVKKSRYAIMRDYMQTREGLGIDMMTRTCSIQLNLDFINEQDMIAKTRLAACLVPIFSLLCSSSGFLEGKATKHALERSYIWQQTDRDRTGISSIIFNKNFGYEAWIEYALDVPMYFIRRGNNYINAAGASFRDFINQGLFNYRASMRDFIDHLSTIFTEIRLKPFLELRSTDSLPFVYLSALSALTWDLFYNKQSLNKALNFFADISYQELLSFYEQTIKIGRLAKFRGQDIFELCQDLLNICQNKIYLKPFEDLINKNMTCAEYQKERYSHIDQNNIEDLISYFSPLAKPVI